jgi:hypothetical protein
MKRNYIKISVPLIALWACFIISKISQLPTAEESQDKFSLMQMEAAR